ncbi:MAG: DUF6279 family lipoprotein [Pseudomonadota bacterium]
MKNLLLLLVLLVIAGCSTSFVYNHIDWLAVEYVEDYVELDESQEQLVSDKVAQLTAWHRQHEIPSYVAYLDELLAVQPSAFTLEQMRYHEDKIRTYTKRLADQVAPEIALLASQLSDQQAEEFMDSLRVRHTKYKNRYQDLSDSEIKQRYQARIEKNLKRWLGRLTEAQQQVLSRWVDGLQITSRDWIAHQTKIRVEINALLEQRNNPDVFNPRLNTLISAPESYYSATLANKIEHNREVARVHLTEVINLMTERQTEHFRDEVTDWKQLAMDIQ